MFLFQEQITLWKRKNQTIKTDDRDIYFMNVLKYGMTACRLSARPGFGPRKILVEWSFPREQQLQ